MREPDVLIVGAGLSGLCCGRRLAACGVSFRILEVADGIGGPLRTDLVDGFRLDRGLPFYLTASPEGRRVLDLAALDLKPFARAVLIWYRGKFHRLADPRREPFTTLRSLFNPVGSIRDKLRLVRLAWDVERGRPERTAESDDWLTLDMLRWNGKFSVAMIDRFFRPLLGCLFLDRDFTTSDRIFRSVLRLLLEGGLTVPAMGMQAIPDHIAAGLPAGSVRLESRIERLGDRAVVCDGETVHARAVVVATDAREAARLVENEVADPGSKGCVTLFYAAPRPPVSEPIVMLDGEGRGPVNHASVMSNVSARYAPAGRALISGTVVGTPSVGDEQLDRSVRDQLATWFGSAVREWRLLRVNRRPEAIPKQTVDMLDSRERPVRIRPGLYVCGSHRDNATVDGAVSSGFRAAQAVMEDLDAGRC